MYERGTTYIRVFLLLHVQSTTEKDFPSLFSTSQVDEKIRENESSRNLFTLSAGELDAGYIFFSFFFFLSDAMGIYTEPEGNV